ncbi:MAG: hypothetical protein M1575_04250 [Patescibacteria group bacterium]|nr:hypothetical protein [Patescibacteria group bacterium]MCL5095902.1 hypothetical protein [Patescibacteria group bacterium]
MKKVIIFGCFFGILILLFSAKPLISPTIKQALRNSINQAGPKTYTNNKFNFKITLPFDWQIEEWNIEEASNLKNVPDGTILSQEKFFGQDGHFEIIIWENKSKTPLRTWLTWYRHEDLILADLPKQENFQIANLPAIRYLQKKTSKKKPILYIFFLKDGRLFELTQEREDLVNIEATLSSQLANPLYDEMLKSFQFLTETSVTPPGSPR